MLMGAQQALTEQHSHLCLVHEYTISLAFLRKQPSIPLLATMNLVDIVSSTVILIEDVRYQDQLKFRNLEAGLIGLYNISDLRFGIGAKGNYRIGLEHRYYYENHPQRLDGWRSDDVSYYFNNLSVDVGIRLEYPIFRNILLASEGWFGITDLSKEEHNMFVRENHFRLMVGYRF